MLFVYNGILVYLTSTIICYVYRLLSSRKQHALDITRCPGGGGGGGGGGRARYHVPYEYLLILKSIHIH